MKRAVFWRYGLSIGLLSTFFGLWPSLPAWSDGHIEDDLHSWNLVTLRAPLSPGKKLFGYMEVQPRVDLLDKEDQTHMQSLILRPALGYQVSKKISLWQGYGWTPTYQPTFRHEHRIFQQLQVENKVKRLNLVNRTRLEERFIENAGGTAVRARHMLRGVIPLGKSGKWSAVAYDELFINLNSTDNGPRSGFDQNRVFAGINRKLNDRANIEAGYLAQYIRQRNPNPDRLNHVILLTLNLNLN